MNTGNWNNEPERCPSHHEVNEMLCEINNFTKLILTENQMNTNFKITVRYLLSVTLIHTLPQKPNFIFQLYAV